MKSKTKRFRPMNAAFMRLVLAAVLLIASAQCSSRIPKGMTEITLPTQEKNRTGVLGPGEEELHGITEGFPPTTIKLRPPANTVEGAKTWAEAKALLPKDSLGGPDWVKALDEGIIKPRGTIKGDDKPAGVMNLDVVLVAKGMPNVRFSHRVHTSWLACTNCHPDIFQMKRGGNPMTMGKIFAGEYCGRCHGKVSFPLTNCMRCHSVTGGLN